MPDEPATVCGVYTAADLCELMDRLTRFGGFSHGFTTGYDLFQAARDQSLVDDQEIGRLAVWVGELVGEGLVVFQSHAAGQPAVPPDKIWGDTELQSHVGYRVSVAGRADAERTRRLRREVQAELVLAGRLQLDGIRRSTPRGEA